MALFNESLVGRFNRTIERLHGHKGGPPAPQIAPEISHHVVLENDRIEHYYLGDTGLWEGSAVVAAVAANFTFVNVVNPSGSGQLVIVQGILVNVTATFNVFTFISGGVANINSQFRDTRNAPTLVGPVAITSVTQAGDPSAGVTGRIRLPAPGHFPIPYVLKPGTGLTVCPALVNVGADVSFYGYNRVQNESEL